MATKYTKWPNIDQHLPFQDPPKFTQIGIFGFENIPSGNPASQRISSFSPDRPFTFQGAKNWSRHSKKFGRIALEVRFSAFPSN
jgi:hypothetical protein